MASLFREKWHFLTSLICQTQHRVIINIQDGRCLDVCQPAGLLATLSLVAPVQNETIHTSQPKDYIQNKSLSPKNVNLNLSGNFLNKFTRYWNSTLKHMKYIPECNVAARSGSARLVGDLRYVTDVSMNVKALDAELHRFLCTSLKTCVNYAN